MFAASPGRRQSLPPLRHPDYTKTLLSHAEVQANLGIKHRGKRDISGLPFDPSVKGAKACGDLMRSAVAALL